MFQFLSKCRVTTEPNSHTHIFPMKTISFQIKDALIEKEAGMRKKKKFSISQIGLG
jgi:hypothetical protein